MYVDATNAWYDSKTNLEVVNLNLWAQLQEAVDIFGLTALDRLFCFVIVRELQVEGDGGETGGGDRGVQFEKGSAILGG